MIRGVSKQMIISVSRKLINPRFTSTISVKPFFDVIRAFLVISPCELVTMVTKVKQTTVVKSLLKKSTKVLISMVSPMFFRAVQV